MEERDVSGRAMEAKVGPVKLPASSKGCCLNPEGCCIGTLYHPFSTALEDACM